MYVDYSLYTKMGGKLLIPLLSVVHFAEHFAFR